MQLEDSHCDRRELLERLATEPHTRLRYFCSLQHTDSALYPIISQMQRAASFAHGDNVQLERLTQLHGDEHPRRR